MFPFLLLGFNDVEPSNGVELDVETFARTEFNFVGSAAPSLAFDFFALGGNDDVDSFMGIEVDVDVFNRPVFDVAVEGTVGGRILCGIVTCGSAVFNIAFGLFVLGFNDDVGVFPRDRTDVDEGETAAIDDVFCISTLRSLVLNETFFFRDNEIPC